MRLMKNKLNLYFFLHISPIVTPCNNDVIFVNQKYAEGENN